MSEVKNDFWNLIFFLCFRVRFGVNLGKSDINDSSNEVYEFNLGLKNTGKQFFRVASCNPNSNPSGDPKAINGFTLVISVRFRCSELCFKL